MAGLALLPAAVSERGRPGCRGGGRVAVRGLIRAGLLRRALALPSAG